MCLLHSQSNLIRLKFLFSPYRYIINNELNHHMAAKEFHIGMGSAFALLRLRLFILIDGRLSALHSDRRKLKLILKRLAFCSNYSLIPINICAILLCICWNHVPSSCIIIHYPCLRAAEFWKLKDISTSFCFFFKILRIKV